MKYHKRVVFPSTSEVYGACPDPEFKEDESFLVVGPIQKERWIYSCCKQLLDRVIYAYGTRGHLEFTLFRPFNWVGPRLDSLNTAKEGSSRVVTQFIAELLMKRPISLVDGGSQKRCFTYVDDGIAALLAHSRQSQRRLQEPDHQHRQSRQRMLRPGTGPPPETALHGPIPTTVQDATYSEIIEVPAQTYYGKGYQDIYTRKPSIEKAQKPPGLVAEGRAGGFPPDDPLFLPRGKRALPSRIAPFAFRYREERFLCGEKMTRILGLKIDVDTYQGMKPGVPRLLALLRQEGLRATFYLSIGPDASGRALLQILKNPGFSRRW